MISKRTKGKQMFDPDSLHGDLLGAQNRSTEQEHRTGARETGIVMSLMLLDAY